ncbi:13249_t:CDS:1, partial [Racocetra fulgida]
EINLISNDKCQINENEYRYSSESKNNYINNNKYNNSDDDDDYASKNSNFDISNDKDGYYNEKKLIMLINEAKYHK